MKHLTLVMLLLVGALGASAQQQQKDAMVVETTAGEKVLFFFEEKPEMAFAGDVAEITTTTDKVQYPLEEVKRIYFDEKSGIAQTEADETRFYFDGNTLRVEGLEVGEQIGLYAVGGALLRSAKADADGRVDLSTESLSTGVYIVKTKSISYKIVKG